MERMITVKAVFEGGGLRLLNEIPLHEGETVEVQIKSFTPHPNPDIQAALDLLHSFLHEEEYPGEQAETLEYLKRVLDEDRLSDRKLFP